MTYDSQWIYGKHLSVAHAYVYALAAVKAGTINPDLPARE